jgi:hypothetical protein
MRPFLLTNKTILTSPPIQSHKLQAAFGECFLQDSIFSAILLRLGSLAVTRNYFTDKVLHLHFCKLVALERQSNAVQINAVQQAAAQAIVVHV